MPGSSLSVFRRSVYVGGGYSPFQRSGFLSLRVPSLRNFLLLVVVGFNPRFSQQLFTAYHAVIPLSHGAKRLP